jgi:hypothetical protein
MSQPIIERHHWVNTLVGMLNIAFILSKTEELTITQIINQLLLSLNIPDRLSAVGLPAAVALEAEHQVYSKTLSNFDDTPLNRVARTCTEGEMVVSLESWSQALASMINSTYPDLEPLDRLRVLLVFREILSSLGVPARVARAFPDEVIKAYQEFDLTYR